jgi:hypothetical protein
MNIMDSSDVLQIQRTGNIAATLAAAGFHL